VNVGVVGCGRMGRALGARAARAGHTVVFGSHEPGFAQEAARSAGHGAAGGSYADAVAPAELVLLATRWQQTFRALTRAGSWNARTVLDATNPSTPDGLSLLLGHTTSGAEEIARAIPDGRVVKAFNHVYAEVVAGETRFGGVAPTVFYCGDDAGGNALADRFIRGLGFDAAFVGPLSAARYLEPAAQLMVALVEGQRQAPTGVALGLLRNPAFREAHP
jgi:predicted dinucleotide-binding enzyme